MITENIVETQTPTGFQEMVRVLNGLPQIYTQAEFMKNFFRDFGEVLPNSPEDVLWPFLKQHAARRFKMTKRKTSSFWRYCTMGWRRFISERNDCDVSQFMYAWERVLTAHRLLPKPNQRTSHKRQRTAVVVRWRGGE